MFSSYITKHQLYITKLFSYCTCVPAVPKVFNMAPVIERVVEDIEFGEGPHWDIQSRSLYFVDYLKKSINRYVPATNSHFKAKLGGEYSSFVIPVDGQQQKFVIGVLKEIATVKWDGVKENIEEVQKLVKVDDLDNKNILNDGKCDAAGRLWTGTLRGDIIDIIAHTTDESEETLSSTNKGSIYSYSTSLKKHFDGVDISNGIAWNKNNTKMFYIDTMTKRVDQFDFDIKTGEISNRKVLFCFEKNEVNGLPDGMTIDNEDNLWVAVYRGSKIIKISTKIPNTLLETINLPAKQVTSMAWGGENLDELYVTTANFPEAEISTSPPVDGSLYRITGLNARVLVLVLHSIRRSWSRKNARPRPRLRDFFGITSVGKEIAIVTWDGVKENIEEIKTLVKVDNFDNKNRLNDGKCDVLGRLWTGTLRSDVTGVDQTSADKKQQNKTHFWELDPNSLNQSESVTGSFYSYSDGNLKRHFDEVYISNGIAWNKDNTRMFFIDTMKNRVDQFDFEVKSGTLSNRRVLFSFTKNHIEGMPDGMTIDDDDNLWIAVFRGSKIVKISTSIPETQLETINLPAKQVTSAAWGGKGLDELYVTTGIFDDASLKPPINSSLYKITGLKAKGLPMHNFRL